jgi:hypothetical protein
MAEIYAAKVYGVLGGGATNSNLVTASGTASIGVATTTITGDIRMHLLGTFSSTTAKLQIKDPNGVYADVSGGSATAAVQKVFAFPQHCRNTFRTLLSQSSTAFNLSIWLQGANK